MLGLKLIHVSKKWWFINMVHLPDNLRRDIITWILLTPNDPIWRQSSGSNCAQVMASTGSAEVIIPWKSSNVALFKILLHLPGTNEVMTNII